MAKIQGRQRIGSASRSGRAAGIAGSILPVYARIPELQRTIQALATASGSIPTALEVTARSEAARIKLRLQAAATAAYVRAQTGRFAMGINTRVSNTTQGDVYGRKIVITLPGYRETRFLTDVGKMSQNRQIPFRPPYFIRARNRKWLKLPVGGEGVGATERSYIAYRPVDRWKKVKGGGAKPIYSKRLLEVASARMEGELNAFVFRKRVRHPGFRRDVVREILEEEGFDYFDKNKKRVSQSLRLAFPGLRPTIKRVR